MKIVHLATHQAGGAGTAAFRLHLGLLAKGIDSSFLCAYAKGSKPSIFVAGHRPPSFSEKVLFKLRVRRPSKPELELAKVKGAGGKYDYYSVPFSNYELQDHPLVAGADVINLHWVANFVNFPTFFATLKKPVIWTFHDMNPFMGGFHYRNDYKKNIGNEQLTGLEEEYTRVKERALKGFPLTVCSPSRWLNDESMSSAIMKDHVHHHIPYGLDTAIFRDLPKKYGREVFNIPMGKKVLLFISEVIENERKGFDLLLEAVKTIEYRDDYVLVAVGDAGKDYNVKNLISISGVHDERLMALLYSAADVCIIPSREDNLPNVMLESLACGTPVIGFPIGGISETIVDDVNGYLCEEVSHPALSRALDRFFDKEVWDTAAIRAESVKKYDLLVQADAYTALYEGKLHKL